MGAKRLMVFGVGLWLVLAARPVVAHHAFAAEFDAAKPVRLQGTVTEMEWTNPHSWLYLDVKKEDGTVESWAIEAGAPNAMYRRGFTSDSVPVGIELVIEGFLAKDGSMRANGRDITFPDGGTLFIGSSAGPGPSGPPQ